MLGYHPKPAPLVDKSNIVSPERKSSWPSRLTFSWLDALIKIGYSRPLEATDLWRLEDFRLSASMSDALERAFFVKYANVDAKFREARKPGAIQEKQATRTPSDDSIEELDSGKTHEGILVNGRGVRTHLPDVRTNLQPMTSRADQPGIEVNPKDASIRDAEKSFVADPKGFKFSQFFKRTKIKDSEKLSDEEYEKAATKAHTMRIIYALLYTIKKQMSIAVCVRLISRGMNVASSVVLKELLRFATDSHRWHNATDLERESLKRPRSVGAGFGLAVGLVVMLQTIIVLNGVHGFNAMLGGSLLRTGVIDQVSRKSMRLSTRARVKQTNGRITTAITGDAAFIDNGAYALIDVIVEPIAILAGFALLLYNLRVSALVGIGVLLASSPILAALFNKLVGSRQAQMALIDKRVRLLSEVLKSIRQIKIYAYEAFFGERIIQIREKELSRLKINVLNRSMVVATMTFLPTLAAVLTFITYGLVEDSLEPATIFAAFQLFNIIQVPLQNLPTSMTYLTDAWVAAGRLSDILLAEEGDRDVHITAGMDNAIEVYGDFTYETSKPPDGDKQANTGGRDRKAEKLKKKEKAAAKRESKRRSKQSLPPLEEDSKTGEETEVETPFALRDIDLRIPKGAFVCIVGRIGAGKTALLQALLGDVRQTRGQVNFGGTLSYVSQQSWIQNATLRDNITFGAEELDEVRLRDAIETCALSRDIEQLAGGLETEIGERGINLSGGQKARVALARAVYFNADIALLDSPLAAVDSHVSSHLIEKCLLGDRGFGSKTRILVTHHLEVLPMADLVLVMEQGRIVQQGTYAELVSVAGVLQTLIEEHGNEDEAAEDGKGDDLEKENAAEKIDFEKAKGQPNTMKLMMDEERNTGGVTGAIYVAYARVMGTEWYFPTSMVLIVLSQACSVLNTLFLGFWSGRTISGFRQGDYIALYATFGALTTLCTFFGSYALFLAGIRASFILFDSALRSVLRSPVSFHDATPVGRIIHRLSADVEKLDDRLTYQWYNFLASFMAVIGTVFLVFYTYPYLGIIFAPLLLIYYLVGKYYSRTSRENKRIDSLLRSFVYTAFGEQLGGMSIIRAFGHEKRFLRRMQKTADSQMRSEYIMIALSRWLIMRLDTLGTALVLGITLFGVGFRNDVDPIKLGVVLTYSMRTAQVFGFMVHYGVQIEQDMNTTERLLHYVDLDHEAAPHQPQDPPKDWPQRGHVVFRNVEMRYRPDLPLVLKGLTFEAQAGEKIGIVGRTGAGKSSLAQALFRIVELASGSIEIDGYDLNQLGLDTLRGQMSALPQDTLLFSGTMRENLDPTGIKTDAELNDVLHRCGLVPTSEQLEKGHDVERYKKFQLDAVVADDGENFSGGERQLVALCRALVKNSHVLLLDEATSSVDPETDAIIQKCIRKEFSHVTLLCIAHRLATIAFYDKVLVMEAGQIAEFDSPLALFDRPDSIFRSMCDAAKLSRDAIVRIRAGEDVALVDGETRSIKGTEETVEDVLDRISVESASKGEPAEEVGPTAAAEPDGAAQVTLGKPVETSDHKEEKSKV